MEGEDEVRYWGVYCKILERLMLGVYFNPTYNAI